MSDNFGRKKSQRWVSVSKGNYNGQEWDSSDEETEAFSNTQDPSGSETIAGKAPPLPRLSHDSSTIEYSAGEDEDSQINEGTNEQSPMASTLSSHRTDQDTASNEMHLESTHLKGNKSIASEFEYSESDDDDNDEEEYRVPKTGYFASMMEFKDSNHGNEAPQESEKQNDHSNGVHENTLETENSGSRKVSIDHSEESLKDTGGSNLATGTPQSTAESHGVPRGLEKGPERSADSADSMPAQTDVTRKTSDSKDSTSEATPQQPFSVHDSSGSSSERLNADRRSSNLDEICTSRSWSTRSNRSVGEEHEAIGELNEDSFKQHTPVRPSHSRTRSVVTDASGESFTNRKTSVISSDGYEDNASFFNHYGNNSPQSSSAGGSNRSPQKAQASSPLKLRYTSKTDLHPSDMTEHESATEVENVRSEERSSPSDNGTNDSDVDDDESVIRIPKNGYYAQIMKDFSKDAATKEGSDTNQSHEDAESDIVSTETGSITDSIQASRARSFESQNANQEKLNSEPESPNDAVDDNGSVRSNEERKKSALRQSINLGKWQPDTDANRANFLGGATPTDDVPEGYVVDRDGQLVDLNPSKMRTERAISMYSDAASAWNAFPASAGAVGGDTDTVYDTKTIYDNQTIFNVPGAILNHNSLPPLPRDVSESARTNTIADSDSILKHLNGEKRHHTSNLKEDFSVQAPDSSEIAQLNKKTIPSLDLDALLQSKSKPHATKIRELTSYSRELNDYDSGLHIWISFALKSSASDRDYIFDEYKVNKHVKDAYAQADELGKKMTVSNTVANVNQNVSHLKRKVFSHSMKEKSKGLFSSIGKKKT
ncbi:LAFA_0B00892g1_1 [Lachancea sp. 'fantastica']|nr:LAFA_0B00892g1_1 [Lachancea sp. 'fantastica']